MKPVDIPHESLAWYGDLLTRLDGRDDFRVAPLLRTVTGDLSTDGWFAWRFEEGVSAVGQWDAIIDAGRRLHRALAAEPRPDFLDRRTDWWAVADRVAWGQEPWSAWDTMPMADEIAAQLVVAGAGPDHAGVAVSQLVHGDLAQNVLFAPGRPPLIIDLSPYWRPVGFADAVVVIDALAWHGAAPDLPARHPHVSLELLLRAIVFRMITVHQAIDGVWPDKAIRRYRRVLDTVLVGAPS